jgi:hypothetical protein
LFSRKLSTCRFRVFVFVGSGCITRWPYFLQLRARHRMAIHLQLPNRSRTDYQSFSGGYSNFSRWCTVALITFQFSDMTVWWLGFRSCCLATNLPMHRTEESVRLSCHSFEHLFVLTHYKRYRNVYFHKRMYSIPCWPLSQQLIRMKKQKTHGQEMTQQS